MRPVQHPLCNDVLRGGAPHIPDLHIRRDFDGVFTIVASYWRPTLAELADLQAGGCVELRVLGTTHAPLSLGTVLQEPTNDR